MVEIVLQISSIKLKSQAFSDSISLFHIYDPRAIKTEVIEGAFYYLGSRRRVFYSRSNMTKRSRAR